MRKRDCVPCLEYKSADSAWYEVSLKLENDKLIIQFEGDFAEAPDEEFYLENVKDLQELEAAFRLPSRQLIDKDCEKVTPGMVVCASPTGMDRRTFDARVEKVTGSKFRHISVDGEEQCNCIYEVLWLAGPYEGERTSIYCENIYLLQSKKIQKHPVIKDVVKFLENRKNCKSPVAVENINQINQAFNYRPNVGSNILQKLFYNDDKREYLVQKMIYGIQGNCVLNGKDTDRNLCSLKQENRDTLAAACKSEGDASERNSIACIHSLKGDAKDGSGGWIDDDSPRIGKNHEGNVLGSSDNYCSYLSRTGDANLVNRNKEFSEDWSTRLGNCNKTPSLMIFEDENGDMQTDFVIVSPPNTKAQKKLDVAKNEGVMIQNRDTLVKPENKVLESTPKSCCGPREDLLLNPTSKYTASKDLPLVQCKCLHHSPTGLQGFYTDLSHGDYKHHYYFCRSCCPCCTHFHLSNECCVECGRYMGKFSMNVCRPRRVEELQDQQKLFSSSHVILIENLDKDVNPSDVLSIILQAGVDFVKVYVSPPQSFQNSMRGIVFLKDPESFQRVSAYLQDENIIVTSSKGRPWVVIDADNGLSEGSFGGFSAGPKCCEISSNKFKICWRGTPEYESAKRLKGKFLEWWEDLKRLHQAFANKETAL